MFYLSEMPKYNRIPVGSLIGIICGSVAFALLIIGFVIFMIRKNSKEISSESTAINDLDTSSSKRRENQTEYIDQGLAELAVDDEDKWI